MTPSRVQRVEWARPAESDRWHRQSKSGGPTAPKPERGDCVPACLTSLLGLPLHAIANSHEPDWFEHFQRELAAYGWSIVEVGATVPCPPGLWIATVPALIDGLNEDGSKPLHAIVVQGDRVVHDPANSDRYTDEMWRRIGPPTDRPQGWVLVPLDPLSLVPSGVVSDKLDEAERLGERLARACHPGDWDDGFVAGARWMAEALGVQGGQG